jgi:hypothetical protein
MEDKIDDKKDRVYEELARIFSTHLTYHMKILLGEIYAKLSRKDIFKTIIGYESSHNKLVMII